MNIDNKTILDNILATLGNDETLSSYVKKISHGDTGTSRTVFPFISVGAFHIRPEKMMAGSICLLYTIEIIAGTRSLAPGVAYCGSEGTGKKGITDLCEDIANAIRGQTFGNVFEPVYSVGSNPNRKYDKSGTLHLGVVSFMGRRWEKL